MKRKYDWRNWKAGERVKPNPNYDWSGPVSEREGTVIYVSQSTLKVRWDNDMTAYYSYADSSLLKINKLIPDELFEI